MSKQMWGKMLFVLGVLLFMVVMGMSNRSNVDFRLMGKDIGTLPAAILYFVFFGVGALSGAVMAVGFRKSDR